MNFTLLIWEEVPEETKLYLIPNDVADKYRTFLAQAHSRMINSDEMNDGLNFLNSALCSNDHIDHNAEYYGLEEPWAQYMGIFAKFKQDFKQGPIHIMRDNDALITSVYLSGFIL